MMHKNKIWIAFLVIVAMAVLWFSGRAAQQLYDYYTLTGEVQPKQIEWAVKRVFDDRHLLEASYAYQVDGTEYEGTTLFSEPIYRNAWVAEQGLKESATKTWVVSYTPKDPAQSTINREFPLKETLSAGVLWGLLLYFTGLGYYVGRRN